jgi:group I intron endonuclease
VCYVDGMKQYVIYKITNVLDGKLYVRSSNGSALRWRAHLQRLRKGNHHSRHLQFAFTRDGEANFVFLIVEVVDDPIFLLAREQFWIWRTRASEMEFGYNTALRPDGPFGYRHTAEAIARISAAGAGRKYPGRTLSAETRAKIGLAHTGMTRREGTGAKISAALKGRKVAPEAIVKMLATKEAKGSLRNSPRKGVTLSQETKDKISVSKKGKSIASKGRKKSPETCAAISVGQLRRRANNRARREMEAVMADTVEDRMIREKTQLDEKVGRLRAFINSDAFLALLEGDRELLDEQFDLMKQYSDVLGIRIGRLGSVD